MKIVEKTCRALLNPVSMFLSFSSWDPTDFWRKTIDKLRKLTLFSLWNIKSENKIYKMAPLEGEWEFIDFYRALISREEL